MGENVCDVLNVCFMNMIINFIPANVVNYTCSIFKVLCYKMGSGHTDLLLNTNVKWFSRGKLTCLNLFIGPLNQIKN